MFIRAKGSKVLLGVIGALGLALLCTPPLWGGGGVVLMGIDAEDGGPGAGHGPISIYEDVVTAFLRNCVRNGGAGILVIGGGKDPGDDVTRFWDRIQADTSIPVTYVNGGAISTQRLDGFAMIAVVSDIKETPSGGLTQEEHDALVDRQGDVAAFINRAGSLIGFASTLTNAYGYLAGVGTFRVTQSSALRYQGYNDIKPTPAGTAIGITDALDLGRENYWHNTFRKFPDFLQILATNDVKDTPTFGEPAAIGGCPVEIEPPCLKVDIKRKKVLCSTDGSGDFYYTFEFTNLAKEDIYHLFILDPEPTGVTISPDYKGFPGAPHGSDPIVPGGSSGSVPVTIRGAKPGDEVSFTLSTHNENLEGCCSIEYTVALPPCDCAQIVSDTPACRFLNPPPGASGIAYSFTPQNLTSVDIQNVLVAPVPPPNLTIQPNRFKVSLPHKGDVTSNPLSIQMTGAGSSNACFLIGLHDASLDQCCSIKRCVTADYCFNLPFDPIGGATAVNLGNEVRVANLGNSGAAGVRVDLRGTRGVELEWLDLDAAGVVPEGAFLDLAATAKIGDKSNQPIGHVRALDAGTDVVITADLGPLGATAQRAEVFSGEQLVGTVAIPSGDSVLIDDWPTGGGIEKLSDGVAYDLEYEHGILWQFLSTSLLGDRLRLIADTPAVHIDALETLNIRAADIPTIRFTAEIERRDAGLTPACVPGSARLCLNGGRFAVELDWNDFQGGSGPGKAISITQDTGYFWFFNPANVELIVKVLDGRAVNGKWWVFYGALSNVEYTLRITDTITGASTSYFNPLGRLASMADTEALSAGPVSGVLTAETLQRPMRSAAAPLKELVAAPHVGHCSSDSGHLCLEGGRFQVQVAFKQPVGGGSGSAVTLTDDTGYFWFFNRENVELVVKLLDGRLVNNHWWVFYGSLSDVEYTITVTDTVTGVSKSYTNPAGHLASIGDTAAF